MIELVEIEIRPSRRHLWFIAGAHIAVLIWLMCLGWEGFFVPVAAFLVLCSGLLSGYRWRCGDTLLRYLDQSWFIDRNGRMLEFVIEPDLYVSPWMVVVRGKAGGRKISIPVFSDSLKPERWRQLRALLVSACHVTT